MAGNKGQGWGQQAQRGQHSQQQQGHQPQQQQGGWSGQGQQPQDNDKGFRGLDRGFFRGNMICNLAEDPKKFEIRTVNTQNGPKNCITVPVVVNDPSKGKPSVFLVTFWEGLGQALWEHKVKGQGLHLEVEISSAQSNGQWYQNFTATHMQFLN